MLMLPSISVARIAGGVSAHDRIKLPAITLFVERHCLLAVRRPA
jgi:hypothetical protein